MGTSDKHYEDRVIRPWEFIDRDGIMDGYTFEGCDIRGPAVLVFQGTTITHNEFRGDPEAFLWEIPPDRPLVFGAVLAKNCTFTNCVFENIGVAGPSAFIQEFRKGSGLD